MLTYHPALDSYHSAFRVLRILLSVEDQGIEVDKVRILDFLLAFPLVLENVRLSKSVSARVRKLSLERNGYILSADPRLVFTKIAPLQHQAIKILAAARLLEIEEPGHQGIRKSLAKIPLRLKVAAMQRNARDSELMSILVNDIAPISLLGRNGLKDRTGLMEFRYDPV